MEVKEVSNPIYSQPVMPIKRLTPIVKKQNTFSLNKIPSSVLRAKNIGFGGVTQVGELFYSDHALMRIKQRKIPIDLVEYVINNKQERRGKKGTFDYYFKLPFKKDTLQIVVNEAHEIVTALWKNKNVRKNKKRRKK